MVSRGYLVLSALLVAGCVGLSVQAPGSAQPPAAPRYGPIQENWPGAVAYSISDPGALPQGMNTGCGGNSGRERPVVLLNGAFLNKYATWSKAAPKLAAAGYCVFGLDYGTRIDGPFHQMGDLRRSAAEIGRFIDTVKARTGAEKVDVVGYSEGGMVPFYLINELGGHTDIHTFVVVASPMRGMSFYGMLEWLAKVPGGRALMNATVPAAADGVKNSGYMREIARNGLTRPGVNYVTISSRNDRVVALSESMLPPGPNVTNVVVQDHCPAADVFHGRVPYDDTVIGLILHALDPATAAKRVVASC